MECYYMTVSIRIKLTRDAVCMADDVDDHVKIISITPPCDTMETLMCIAKEYLPRITGYNHTWECILNGIKCAIINGNCVKISSIASASFSEINELYFKYHAARY